ncbi:pecanex-like protein 4 isoform X3 [Denticeps clupeoides]|nr:pecanex-like protein 4 isoform X3 [Denticeps clupeoides]
MTSAWTTMGPDVPLLNEYKQEFFWKRFPQTLLGGPRFRLGYCAPPYVYLQQLLLLLTPWLLGGVATLLFQLGVLGEAPAAALSGALMVGVAAALQGLAQSAAQRSERVRPLANQNILADEEEVEFTHCVAPETVHFIVPGKRFMGNAVLHTLLAGALCGLATWYLLPARLGALFGGVGTTAPLFALSWVTVCIGEYALVVNSPTETATFQPQDAYEISALTRPLFILIFISVDLAQRFLGPAAELQLACQVLHVLFVTLPVLWALGTLPPPDALLLWALEEILVLGLGGSPMATNLRLVLMFLFTLTVAVGTYFIPSSLGVVVFSVAAGYLLSLDVAYIGAVSRSSRFRWWPLPLLLVFLVGSVVEGTLLQNLHPEVANLSLASGPGADGAVVGLRGAQGQVGYVLIGLLVVTWSLTELQGMCLLGGVLRNPLYPRRVESAQAFRQSSRALRITGVVRRLLLQHASPFAMVAFLSLDPSVSELHTVSLAVGFTRAFRLVPTPPFLFTADRFPTFDLRTFRPQVWQRTDAALLQMVLVLLVRLASTGTPVAGWHRLGTGVQLLLVGFALDRGGQFLAKLRFALTVLVTSWTETKQRRRSAAALLALNAALCPFLLAVLLTCALLSAPLLPLFTLPVFLVGFPRPLRSWPGTPGCACPCADSVYYQQLSGRLAAALRSALACGALGPAPPGSHLLCRIQDRMVWLTVLERGFGFWTLNIKGLELQETSCHTLEARRVDEVFDWALSGPAPSDPLWRRLNPHWGNTLTPRCVVPVTLYSDARNVLTGIIDSHEHLGQFRGNFLKVLLWLLLRRSAHAHQHKAKGQRPPPASGGASGHSLHPSAPPPYSSTSSSFSSVGHQGRSCSLASLGDWSDEDDLFGPRCVQGPVRVLGVGDVSLPGSVDVLSLYETTTLPPLHRPRPEPDADEGRSPAHPRFSCPHSETLALPADWSSLPGPRLQQLRPCVPTDWFCFALAQLVEGGASGVEREALAGLQRDQGLVELYGGVALSCLLALGMEVEVPSPSLVYRVYGGHAHWSEALDWLKAKRELYQLALKAFRYSFKILFDQAVLESVETPAELSATLEEYETSWYIGMATEHGWQESVRRETPFLFSLGHDIAMGVYTGRVLSLQEQLVCVGTLNGEAVRGQWANLSWELLYATNDDEERYSIQAHPVLLRNLTVQAAEPPLGYPIYSSRPLSLRCL